MAMLRKSTSLVSTYYSWVGQQNPQFSVEALQNLTLLETFNASSFALPGPIPQWFGFKLASTLQIFDLRFCSITGHIPSNFGYLSNLTIIYLSNNNLITGIVPSGLGQLSSAVLDISRNSLVGSIP
uniref:Probable LRR receptor-like serine/threonine-protein kinase At2g16250 n=2 Tax=Nicotiana TaxID=4085 RepID=A0A1S3ZWB6_TOBAC